MSRRFRDFVYTGSRRIAMWPTMRWGRISPNGPAAGASWRREFPKSLEKSALDGVRGPGGQIIPLERGRKSRWMPEKAPRLGGLEPGKARRLEVGGGSVRGLDQPLQVAGQLGRQAEANPDSHVKPSLHGPLGIADHRLERRDHVADDVFGAIVEQHGKAKWAIEIGLALPCDALDQQRVLRDRKDMRAARL